LRKQYPFKVFSIVGLIVGCLLIVVWFVYLYRASFKETAYQVNDCFEAAFYDKVLKRRLPLLYGQTDRNGKDEWEESVESPFGKERKEFLEKEQSKYKVNRFGVVHMYNPVDLNYRLRSALIMQRSINESGVVSLCID
jgi:two-component system phosphate regulon sensor histidine kinase PhoR